MQYCDVYRPDGMLEFYIARGDSLMAERKYHYSLRNDTIFAENDKKWSVHLPKVNESTMHIDYTRIPQDTAYYFQPVSKRSELPEWLDMQSFQISLRNSDLLKSSVCFIRENRNQILNIYHYEKIRKPNRFGNRRCIGHRARLRRAIR